MAKCLELPNKESRQQFCKVLGIPWGEYKRLKRKYKHILKRYRKEKNEARKSQN